jgi:hypothetical protein
LSNRLSVFAKKSVKGLARLNFGFEGSEQIVFCRLILSMSDLESDGSFERSESFAARLGAADE